MLQPYFSNWGKRLVRSPKIYFYDTGLASYLLGIENGTQMSRDPVRGMLFENMVILELMKYRLNHGLDHGIYFFQDDKQHEVDVLMNSGSGLLAVEIKSSVTFHQDFLKNLKYLRHTLKNKSLQTAVIYAGLEVQSGDEFSLLNYQDASRLLQRIA